MSTVNARKHLTREHTLKAVEKNFMPTKEHEPFVDADVIAAHTGMSLRMIKKWAPRRTHSCASRLWR